MSPYQEFQVLVGLGGLLWLAGCGHPSAASPIASSVDAKLVAEPPVSQSAETPPAAAIDEANGQAPAAEAPPAAAPPAAGQRPPADRTPSRPGEAEKITFEDLNLGMPADVVFREFMLTDRVKELDGKRVSIAGYMHGGQDTVRGVKKFILLKNTQCKFGPGGQADHLSDVWLKEGLTANFTPSPVKIEGTFRIEPFVGPTDGNTWSIYRLEEAQIR